jgi:pilus assembly protein Flp/PilA
MRRWTGLIKDEKGATAVEYALICALIVLAIISGINAVAAGTIGMWNGVSDNIAASTPRS